MSSEPEQTLMINQSIKNNSDNVPIDDTLYKWYVDIDMILYWVAYWWKFAISGS